MCTRKLKNFKFKANNYKHCHWQWHWQCQWQFGNATALLNLAFVCVPLEQVLADHTPAGVARAALH